MSRKQNGFTLHILSWTLLKWSLAFWSKRPHDRVPLQEMKFDWHACLDNKVGFKGFAVPKEQQDKVVKFDFHGQPAEIKHNSVAIATITRCTNTSNPSVMLGAGLVAKNPCELGLESGLQEYLSQQGFDLVGYGYTTCIGNSGDLDESVTAAIEENDVVAAAVLSSNRHLEGRVHGSAPFDSGKLPYFTTSRCCICTCWHYKSMGIFSHLMLQNLFLLTLILRKNPLESERMTMKSSSRVYYPG